LSFKKERRMIEVRRILEEASLRIIKTSKLHKSIEEALYGFVGAILLH
jgi:hypothetical protein